MLALKLLRVSMIRAWGAIEQINFVDGAPVVPPGYAATLERALADVADKTNARLRFVGYTRNERLERRTAAVYGDDIGLSASRARRAMEAVLPEMGPDAQQAEFEGRGYVHSDDVVNCRLYPGRDIARCRAGGLRRPGDS